MRLLHLTFVLVLWTLTTSGPSAEAQKISEGCTTSLIAKDIPVYDLESVDSRRCFWIEAYPIKRKHGIHLTVFWRPEADKLCSSAVIKIKRLEMLVRGAAVRDDYGYPIGEFSLKEDVENSFCSKMELTEGRARNSSEYHHLHNSSLALKALGVLPEILDCGGAKNKKLYNGVDANLLTLNFNDADLETLTSTSEHSLILACALWEYKPEIAPTDFQKLFVDFTCEIEVETAIINGDDIITESHLVAIGLKEVTFKLNSPSSTVCQQISGGMNTTGPLDGNPKKPRPTRVVDAPSEMCNCFRRPLEGSKKQITNDNELMHCFEFSVHNQPDHGLCVLFGLRECKHKYSLINHTVTVTELTIMALNDKGYPYGRWKLAGRRDCLVYTDEKYRTRRGKDFQTEEDLFKENIPCGINGNTDNFLEPSYEKGEIPSQFYFYNPMKNGPVAVAARFIQDKVFPDRYKRPKHLQFIAEFMVTKEKEDPGEVYTVRTATHFMEYSNSSNKFLKAVPLHRERGDILMDVDYFEGLDADTCLPEVDLREDEPPMEDQMCRCFKQSRNLSMSENEHLKKDCIKLTLRPYKPFIFLVTFEYSCEHEGYKIEEVVLQAVTHKGVPFGKWEGVQRQEQKDKCMEGKNFILRQGKAPFKQECTAMPKNANLEPMHKKEDPPELYHYHNPNWGFGSGPRGRPGIERTIGFCGIWIFLKAPGVFKGYTTEFQFIAQAVINDGSGGPLTMVTVRSERYLFSLNEKKVGKQIEVIASSDLDNDVELKTDYHKKVQKNPCLDPMPPPKPDELCSCFNNDLRHRGYNQTDSEVAGVAKCFTLTYHSNGPFSMTWALEFNSEHHECKGLFMYEVVIEAMNEFGMPTGLWQNGMGEEKDSNWLPPMCLPKIQEDEEGEGPEVKPKEEEEEQQKEKDNGVQIDFPECLFLEQVTPYYMQPISKLPRLFHFKNADQSEEVTTFCAKWNYPHEGYEGPYPSQIQFYAQIRAYEIYRKYRTRLFRLEHAKLSRNITNETESTTPDYYPRRSIMVEWRSPNFRFNSDSGTLTENIPAPYEIKEDLDIYLNPVYYETIAKHYPCLEAPGQEGLELPDYEFTSSTTPDPEDATLGDAPEDSPQE